MANSPGLTRSLWGTVLRNFINSFKPRKFFGELRGSDYMGNKYYEIPADLNVGRRKASRYFEPPIKEDFQQELPAEWEAWLRGRRKVVPTEEEITRNLAIMGMKQRNAIEVDKKGGKVTPLQKGMETFPKRTEYEITPGRGTKY